ncbi:MAG: alpha/beta fold hydrolase [Rhodobacteraceae bacterium]|nr:alpha/beta fold hydrolase [Paracoccaceae bacterium]
MRFGLILCVTVTLGACIDRSFTPAVPDALNIGKPYTVFAATSRKREPDGSFGPERSAQIDLLELTVSIPPSHQPGRLEFAYSQPDPATQFTIAERRVFASTGGFLRRLDETLATMPPDRREVVVFVHGYNATQAETAMRAAQLANDIDLPGAVVIYSWPSRGEILGYAYDNDSMMFARDGLERLLRDLRGVRANNVLLVAHSMGSVLAMEALRQADIREPGWSASALGAVVLMSPDIDIDVFRSQMQSLAPPPEPFVVMVSENDRVLNLSARLRGTAGRERLGNIRHAGRVAELPVEVIDATAFGRGAASSHFIAATSPALLAIFNEARVTAKSFRSEKLPIEYLLPPEVWERESATEIRLVRNQTSPK